VVRVRKVGFQIALGQDSLDKGTLVGLGYLVKDS
jgi:hypothetical protein